MTLLGRRFAPSLWPTVATLMLLPLLLWLGQWQLGKSEFKATLIERMAARESQPPLELGGAGASAHDNAVALTTSLRGAVDVPAPDPDSGWRAAYEFTPVALRGVYLADRQFLLDNRTRGGRAGYEVLTPLALADGSGTVLVNRGWVPVGAHREALPDVALTGATEAVSVVDGTLLAPPSPGLKLGPGGFEGQRWPRVVQWADVEAMRSAAGRAGEVWWPAVVALAPDAPNGYAREQAARTFAVPPERHHGYAVQWFALSITLAVIYLALSTSRAGPREANASRDAGFDKQD